MSIPNLFHKIKSKTSIDKMSVVFLFIIVGVGIGSFGLGRMSLNNVLNKEDSGDIIIMEQAIDNNQMKASVGDISSKEKRFVASKNGKMYYSMGCSGVNRIKEVNKIWFSSKEDAEKSGYALSTTCK